MKLIKSLEYLTLGVFAVSVFSIGRSDIIGLSAYFQQLYTEPAEAYLRSFVLGWIIILPFLALICLLYGKTVEYNTQYMLWVVGAILALEILVVFRFMPMSENGALPLGASVLKLGINALTVLAIAFAYSCYVRRSGFTWFPPMGLLMKKKALTNNPNTYKRKCLMAALLCALSAIMMIWGYSLADYSYPSSAVLMLKASGPILLFFGVLKAGNLELVEKE